MIPGHLVTYSRDLSVFLVVKIPIFYTWYRFRIGLLLRFEIK